MFRNWRCSTRGGTLADATPPFGAVAKDLERHTVASGVVVEIAYLPQWVQFPHGQFISQASGAEAVHRLALGEQIEQPVGLASVDPAWAVSLDVTDRLDEGVARLVATAARLDLDSVGFAVRAGDTEVDTRQLVAQFRHAFDGVTTIDQPISDERFTRFTLVKFRVPSVYHTLHDSNAPDTVQGLCYTGVAVASVIPLSGVTAPIRGEEYDTRSVRLKNLSRRDHQCFD